LVSVLLGYDVSLDNQFPTFQDNAVVFYYTGILTVKKLNCVVSKRLDRLPAFTIVSKNGNLSYSAAKTYYPPVLGFKDAFIGIGYMVPSSRDR
jgi:hypothetical protein